MSEDAKHMVWKALLAIDTEDEESLGRHVMQLKIQWIAAYSVDDEAEQAELGRWIPSLQNELDRMRNTRMGISV